MMRKSRLSNSLSPFLACLIAVGGILLAPLAGHASLVNGSFESGDYSGWTLSVNDRDAWMVCDDENFGLYHPAVPPFDAFSVSLVQRPSVVGIFDNFLAVDGSRFLSMMGNDCADVALTGPDGLNYIYSGHVTTSLTQSIRLNRGDSISGLAAFYTWDYPPYQFDSSWVEIRSGGSSVVPIRLSILEAYDEGIEIYCGAAIPWRNWSWIAPEDGVYDLSLNVKGDDQMSSFGLFDGIKIQTVPEPPVTSLLCAGIIPLLVSRRNPRRG